MPRPKGTQAPDRPLGPHKASAPGCPFRKPPETAEAVRSRPKPSEAVRSRPKPSKAVRSLPSPALLGIREEIGQVLAGGIFRTSLYSLMRLCDAFLQTHTAVETSKMLEEDIAIPVPPTQFALAEVQAAVDVRLYRIGFQVFRWFRSHPVCSAPGYLCIQDSPKDESCRPLGQAQQNF